MTRNELYGFKGSRHGQERSSVDWGQEQNTTPYKAHAPCLRRTAARAVNRLCNGQKLSDVEMKLFPEMIALKSKSDLFPADEYHVHISGKQHVILDIPRDLLRFGTHE